MTDDVKLSLPVARLRRAAIFGSATAHGRSRAAFQVFDRFAAQYRIPPLKYRPTRRSVDDYDDSYIRFCLSTSPLAEADSFEAHVRDALQYLHDNPDWREAFPDNKPLVFPPSRI